MAVRRFSAQPATTLRELQTTMRKMVATSLKVNQDLYTGEAEIVFDRAGTRYVFRCAKWKDPSDNLRAAQLSIGYLHRAMEEYGTVQSESQLEATFAQFFAGFQATPDDTVLMLGDGTAPWWEVLGTKRDATKVEIRNAFRALAKIHHPDAGGDVGDFKRLRRAYEQAMEGAKA